MGAIRGTDPQSTCSHLVHCACSFQPLDGADPDGAAFREKAQQIARVWRGTRQRIRRPTDYMSWRAAMESSTAPVSIQGEPGGVPSPRFWKIWFRAQRRASMESSASSKARCLLKDARFCPCRTFSGSHNLAMW
mmetsp:Transcript_80665/g.231665  ORF Transcript_80665/g.231665 Transcript_80665/m.231665 type:complete len:134 (+) Transcript_80665:183-584(+)